MDILQAIEINRNPFIFWISMYYWKPSDIHGRPRISMEIDRNQLESIDIDGSLLMFIEINRFSRKSIDFNSFPWKSMDYLWARGFPHVLQSICVFVLFMPD